MTIKFKKIICLPLFIISLLALSFITTTRCYALTMDWGLFCSVHWEDQIPEITQNGQISALDLLESDHHYDVVTHVWCPVASNDTKTQQHIGVVVKSQSTAGNKLALHSTSNQKYIVPFQACLGDRSRDAHLCADKKDDFQEYWWGKQVPAGKTGHDQSLIPHFMEKKTAKDPNAPDKPFWSTAFSMDYIGHVQIYLDKANMDTSEDNLPIPGEYEDEVKVTFNGEMASGNFAIPDLDITKNNSPTLHIKAYFTASCKINSAPNVELEGAFSSELTAQQIVDVTCTHTTPYTISFKSSNQTTNQHYRLLSADKSHSINYGIYTDSSFTRPWNDHQQYIGTGKRQRIPVYYRTDSTQEDQVAGTYSDEVTITINY